MNAKRPRKRFRSEKSILAAIEKLQGVMLAECKQAEELDKAADKISRDSALEIVHPKMEELRKAKGFREDALVLRKRQQYRDKQMRALKETLARFKTEPMPFMQDHSEELAKL